MLKHPVTKLEALFTIIDRRFENTLLNVYENSDIPVLLVTRGKGTAKSIVYELFG